jgi:hypothetical protein
MHLSKRLLLAVGCLLPTACGTGGEPAKNQDNAIESANEAEATDAGNASGGGFQTSGAAMEAEDQSPTKMVMAAKADSTKCPIMRDGGWKAAVATTIDGERILGVAGMIVVNTGGFDVKLVPGPLDKMNPPNQHFRLEVREPTGVVFQRITPHPVYATAPGQPRYASIVITCRGQEIERITNIIDLPEIGVDPVP